MAKVEGEALVGGASYGHGRHGVAIRKEIEEARKLRQNRKHLRLGNQSTTQNVLLALWIRQVNLVMIFKKYEPATWKGYATIFFHFQSSRGENRGKRSDGVNYDT